MRLLRLELSGFKSFSDKMTVNFVQDGVSIVVGPNGCGKSNIVDAIRWALGEQSAKHLRGASMEDVIFNGSTSRQAVGLAQVSLTFSNSLQSSHKYAEFSEITVTRRLYRSGESQYLINKTPCRLTDIRELFMDTGIGGKGYSIIEQGRVDLIVTSRPEDRRSIIDEAAGIVKFKTKKKEAERKLSQTKDNLLRVEDILQELIRQEETLKEQVEKADEYLTNKSRMERLQQCIVSTRWNNLKKQSEELLKSREGTMEEQEDVERIISAMEADEAKINLDITRKTGELDEFRKVTQNQREDIIKLEGKLDADKMALKNLDEWQKQREEEVERLDRKMEEIEEQLENQDDDAGNLEAEIESKGEALELLQEQNKIQDRELADLQETMESTQKEEVQLITQISGDRNQLLQVQERLQETQQKEHDLENNLFEIEDEEDRINRIIRKETEVINQKKERKESCLEAVRSQQDQIEAFEQSVAELNGKLQAVSKEINQAESRYNSLQEIIDSHEEFDVSTKTFLDYLDSNPNKKEQLGFRGTMAELVSAEDENHPQSSTFLNRFFNLLIFDTVENFREISDLITELDIEQVQLFFSDLIPATENGSTPTMSEWIHAGDSFEGIVPLAANFQPIEFPIATVEPDRLRQLQGLIDPNASLMTAEKIFHVGKPGKNNVAQLFLKRRNEMATLEEKLEELEEKQRRLEEEHESGLEYLEELKRTFQSTNREIVDLDLEILGLEKELNGRTMVLKKLEQDRNNLLKEQEQTVKVQTSFREKIKELSEGIQKNEENQLTLQKEIRKQRMAIEDAKLRKEETTEELQHLQIIYNNLINQQKNIHGTRERLNKEYEQAAKQLEKIRSKAAGTEEERANYIKSIEEETAKLPQLIEVLKGMEEKLREMTDSIEVDRSTLLGLQKAVQEHQTSVAEFRENNHKLDIKLAQLAQEAMNIEKNLYSESGVTPEELLRTFNVEEFNLKKEEGVVRRLKQFVNEHANVNLAAREEYEELVERLDFLQTQSNDLTQSIEALEDSINKINMESRKRFRQTYNQVNEKFSNLFPKLFGGGEAYLNLTDEQNLLETGVEIIARPPGKKLQNMTLLSGGEKAMTAIALIFAIFQIKPSPFCLLDEVDAPLDEANNGRFNQHVQAMTENSQFIIITHNKKTMEIGDALFGVTMEEPGTSKIVSVDFREDSIPAGAVS